MKFFPCLFLLLAIIIVSPVYAELPDYVGGKKIDSLPDSRPDSIIIAANPAYRAGSLHRKFFGQNYRAQWVRPLKFPILYLSNSQGSYRVEESLPHAPARVLVIRDSQGKRYQLRSLEKFPARYLPADLRGTVLEEIVIDGISASHPYGAIAVAALEKAAGFASSPPEVVYLADDSRLGAYRKRFANRLMLMSEIIAEQPVTQRGAQQSQLPGEADLITTDTLIARHRAGEAITIDTLALLRKRIFDLFLLDFNRSDEQWKWLKAPGTTVYQPVDQDRDLFFFLTEGFIPPKLRGPGLLPELQGFENSKINIAHLNQSNISFDRRFLFASTTADWQGIADSLKVLLTDSVIEAAVRRMPTAVYGDSGSRLIRALKINRDQLADRALEYKAFISAYLEIPASDLADSIFLQRDNGLLMLRMSAAGKTYYHQAISLAGVKEIRLFGLAGDDYFFVETGAGIPLLRLIGGEGRDQFFSAGEGEGRRLWVYDQQADTQGESKPQFRGIALKGTAPELYGRNYGYFDQAGFSPRINITLDDGIIPGIAYRIRRQGFYKEPFKTDHLFTADYGIGSGALLFGYKFEAISLFANNDLVWENSLGLPGLAVSFAGYGNDSRLDLRGKSAKYYRTRFNQGYSNLSLRRKLVGDLQVSFGVSFQYANVRQQYNDDRLIGAELLKDIDRRHLERDKYYLGPNLIFSLDTRDNKVITKSGMRLRAGFAQYAGLGEYSRHFGYHSIDLAKYWQLDKAARLILALRGGGGLTTGDAEYFQHQYLSGHTNLRGYRRYRFVGDRMAFVNVEFRYHLTNFRAYLIPGALGLQAFHDMGRVWYKKEASSSLHHGSGIGIWIAPARRIVGTGSLIFSKEGPIPYFTLGFRF